LNLKKRDKFLSVEIDKSMELKKGVTAFWMEIDEDAIFKI
jgi:hypothetical protein